MWWPFRSSNSKPIEELNDELPPNLQNFLNEEDPNIQQLQSSLSHQNFVNKKLSSITLSTDQIEQLKLYKSQNSEKEIVFINCSEIEAHYKQCLENWTFFKDWRSGYCESERENLKQCSSLTHDGLKRLYYNDCYNIDQCKYIRKFIDQAYVKNFGNLGDKITNVNMEKFYNDLDDAFYRIWK